MRAVGYFAPGPITARDLLVEVRAVSVNPVDYKVRASAAPPAETAKVIGDDAAGIVVEAGPQASLFRPGDEVFYAGSIIRSGTNAEFHLVDERIVGHEPRSLGFAEAAALPLTSITAWEDNHFQNPFLPIGTEFLPVGTKIRGAFPFVRLGAPMTIPPPF
jgi:NADPH:quinone reductase